MSRENLINILFKERNTKHKHELFDEVIKEVNNVFDVVYIYPNEKSVNYILDISVLKLNNDLKKDISQYYKNCINTQPLPRTRSKLKQ